MTPLNPTFAGCLDPRDAEQSTASDRLCIVCEHVHQGRLDRDWQTLSCMAFLYRPELLLASRLGQGGVPAIPLTPRGIDPRLALAGSGQAWHSARAR